MERFFAIVGGIALVILFFICYGVTVMFIPRETNTRPGLTIALARPTETPVPTPTVSFIQTAFLIQAQADAESQRTDDSIRHAVVIHELRRETLYDVAWLAMPWAAIVIGGACFVALVRKRFEE